MAKTKGATKAKKEEPKLDPAEAEAERPLEDDKVGAEDKNRIPKDPSKLPGGYAGGKASANRPRKDRVASARKAAETRYKNQVAGPQDMTQEMNGSSWKIQKDANPETAEALQEQINAGDEEGLAVQTQLEKQDADFDPEAEEAADDEAAEADALEGEADAEDELPAEADALDAEEADDDISDAEDGEVDDGDEPVEDAEPTEADKELDAMDAAAGEAVTDDDDEGEPVEAAATAPAVKSAGKGGKAADSGKNPKNVQAGKKSAARPAADRKASAQKAAETRKRKGTQSGGRPKKAAKEI